MKSRTTDMFEYLLAHGIDLLCEPDPYRGYRHPMHPGGNPGHTKEFRVWACRRSDGSRGNWIEQARAPEIINSFKSLSCAVTKKGPDLDVLVRQLLLEFGFEEEFVNRGLECVSEALGGSYKRASRS